MAVVTALQFNESSGAMICDEEYWFLRRRRSFFLDNIRNLIPEKISNALGIEAAYGGWGHPGFHEEVIRHTREMIVKTYEEGSTFEDMPLDDLETIAAIVRQVMLDTRQRQVNNMLGYLYGFGIDDLNQGFFEENGTKYDISQKTIKTEAKKIVTYEKKGKLTDQIFKNKAIVIGYDPTDHFRTFHINAENTVYSLVSGGFEAIGAGKYGAGIEFSRMMNRLTLDERRDGFDRVWGMIALFQATLKAYDYFHEVGGGLNLIYIDGQKKSHKMRYKELSDGRTQLTVEMVKALEYGLITPQKIYPLVDDLIYKDIDRKSVENAFCKSVTDRKKLNRLLRGYKFSPFSEIPNTKSGKTAQGGRK